MDKTYRMLKGVTIAGILAAILFSTILLATAHAELWKITGYCSCKKCCGKWSDGITASGHKLEPGDRVVACNWLPFGTRVKIEGLGVYTVQDRGARSLFGDKDHHIKHLDVWFPDHDTARRFGVKYRKVVILK